MSGKAYNENQKKRRTVMILGKTKRNKKTGEFISRENTVNEGILVYPEAVRHPDAGI